MWNSELGMSAAELRAKARAHHPAAWKAWDRARDALRHFDDCLAQLPIVGDQSQNVSSLLRAFRSDVEGEMAAANSALRDWDEQRCTEG